MFDRSCLKALLIAGLALPIASCSNTGLSKILIAPASVNMTVGQYVQFTAYGYYGNANVALMPNQDITSTVTWGWGTSILQQVTTAQAPNCAVPVKGVCSGLFLAVGVGSTQVGASAPGFGGTVGGGATVAVTACILNCGGGGGSAEPIIALSITPSTDTVAVVGQTAQFIALGTNGNSGLQENLTNIIPVASVNGTTWSSSNAGVATICTPGSPAPCTATTNGLATATGTGTTQITAIWTNPDFSVQTSTATFTVTGTASEPLQSLGITPPSQTILQGQSSQLIAIGTFSSTAATPGTQNLTNSSTVTWSSSNNSIATVTAGGANCTPPTTNCGGFVKAIGPGAAVLTAIASNPDKSVVTATATITVTATAIGSSEPLVSLAIVPATQTSLTTGAKANVNFIAIGTTSSGATVNLTATAYTVPGTSPAQTIPVATWSSSNPSVASFASSTGGVATPNGAGATAITAIATNPDGTVVTGSAAYTVTPTLTEPIVSLAVLPNAQSSLATGVGANVNFIAVGTTSSGATVNLTAGPYTVPGTSPAQTVSMATWTSSNPAVAFFTSNTGGVATPKASGATAITAVVTNPDGTVVTGSASYTVSVPSVKEPYVSLAIVPASQTLTSSGQQAAYIAIGTTGTGATVDLTNAAGVTWSSSSTSVATVVSNGVFKAVADGVTAITAEVPNPGIGGNAPDGTVVTASAELTVALSATPEPLVSLTVLPTTQTSLATGVGANVNFIAIGTTASGASVNLTSKAYTVPGTSPAETIAVADWSSSNPAVASFATATGGVATPNAAGVTAVTAIVTNPDGTVVTGSAVYTVAPALSEPIVSLAVLPASQTSLATGAAANVNFIAIGTTSSGSTVNLTAAPYTVPGTSPAQTVSVASWSSSNPLVASFASSTGGVATPKASGAAAITAIVTNPDGTVVTGSAAYTVSVPAVTEPYVSVAIVPASQTLTAVGQTGSFIAIGTTGAGGTVDLTNATGVKWSANSSGVATLVSNGLFSAVANGVTSVTVEVPNPGINGNPPDGTVVSATGALTVALAATPEPLLSMSIVPGSQTVAFTGETTQFLAIGDFSSSSSTPGNQNMAGISSYTTAWYSSNPSVATVCTPATSTTTANCASTPGLVTAVGQGTTAITAIATNNTDHSAVTASATFTVTGTSPNEITSLVIIPGTQTVTLPLNSSAVPTTFFAAIGANGITGLQQNLTNSVVWTSSNTAVATINSATGAVTALTQGSTSITAQYTNPSSGSTPANVVTATAALNVNGVAAEPLLNITIYPGTQTVNFPGQTSQLVATGTFSTSPVTQNLTTATGQYQLTWISSNPAVATVCTPANASLNIAANCPTTPGLVTAVTQGSVAITAVASNPDTSVVTGVATFTVTNGAAEQMTSLTIIPGALSISATGQPGQFIAIGTSGTTGLQEDVTNSPQIAWSSSIPAYATISTLPSANPGQAQGVSSGTTNITAEFTNPAVGPTPANVVTATASVTVSTTPAAEPLLSVVVEPAAVTVLDLDSTAQYLAFGTFSTTPTVLDITNGFFHQGFPNAACTAAFASADAAAAAADVQAGLPVTNLPDAQCSFVPVTWVSLPDAFVFPINSAGGAGGLGGLITAVGSGGPELVYAVAANPDGTLVYAPGASFSCPYAAPTYGTISVTNGNGVTTTTTDYSDILNPGTCNTLTIGGGLLSTLTVFNANLESTGLNQTNWLITAPSATGTQDVIRCGGTAQQGSTGGSVCEATYPTGTTVTLTAPAETGVNFGGWSSNCTAQGVVTAVGPNSCTVVVGGGCTLNPNTGTYTCTDSTNVSVGAIFN